MRWRGEGAAALEGVLPFLVGDRCGAGQVGPGGAGVVDQDVEAAQDAERFGGQGLRAGLGAQVAGDECGLGLRRLGRRADGDDDLGAAVEQSLGDGGADAARAAGGDRAIWGPESCTKSCPSTLKRTGRPSEPGRANPDPDRGHALISRLANPGGGYVTCVFGCGYR